MSVPSEDKILPPRREKADIVDSVMETAISAIPVLGAPALRLFNLVVAPPLQRRLDEWRNAVAERILRLEDITDGFKVESLGKNSLFITAVMQATQIALRTHQKEKLEALQNAIMNSARGIDIEENLQLLFFGFVDSFTALHLRLLKFFDDPILPSSARARSFLKSLNKGTPKDLLETAIPELKGQANVYGSMVQDLFGRGLLSIDKSALHHSMSERQLFSSHTTDLGKRFLKYIAPQEDTDYSLHRLLGKEFPTRSDKRRSV